MTSPQPVVSPERLQIAYDLVKENVSSGALPVGLLAVADRDELIRCEGYGPSGPIGTDGLYLLASITKPIVATAIMQLVEQGRLLIDDPVARHIPAFGANGKEGVTVWHLLTHTSGLDAGYAENLRNLASPDQPPTPADDLRGALGTFLRFAPGSRFEYNNVAFRILGELITRLGGASYPEYLAKRVFGPAGMADTTFRPWPERGERVLPVHDFPEPLVSPQFFATLEVPSGGLFSTAADLVTFGQALLRNGRGRNGRVLGPAAIATMTRLQTAGIHAAGEPESACWGLGWSLTPARRGLLWSPSTYGHGGATGTQLLIDPENGLVVVFLTNRWGLDERVKRPILNAVFGAIE